MRYRFFINLENINVQRAKIKLNLNDDTEQAVPFIANSISELLPNHLNEKQKLTLSYLFTETFFNIRSLLELTTEANSEESKSERNKIKFMLLKKLKGLHKKDIIN